jgi:hypothetical protein
MPTDIATACGRSDLFALYDGPEDRVLLPVVGFDARGRALIVTKAGSVVLASKARVGNGLRFRAVHSYTDAERS